MLTTALRAWARVVARRPLVVLVVALLAFGALIATGRLIGGSPRDDYNIPGLRSEIATNLVADHLPAFDHASASVVLHRSTAINAALITDLSDRLAKTPLVDQVLPPRISSDGKTVALTVLYQVDVTDPRIMGDISGLQKASEPTVSAGVQVEYGGALPDTVSGKLAGHGELIGVLAALLILALAYRRVASAGIPLVAAGLGLAAGASGVSLLELVTKVSGTAPAVASMVGLGVGIDYSLLVVGRHIQAQRAGASPGAACEVAVVSAGESVIFAGTTVLASLLGLRFAGVPVFESFGFATAIAVLAAMASALTVTPALLVLAKHHTGGVPAPRRALARTPLVARMSTGISQCPVAWMLLTVALLLALAAPALTMRTWPQDPSLSTTASTTRRAHDLMSSAFGAGTSTPALVVIDRKKVTDAAAAELLVDWAELPHVARIGTPVPSEDGAIVAAELEFDVTSADASQPGLIADLRARAPAGVEIGGIAAVYTDMSALLAVRLWVVMAFVVTAAVVLLFLVFRSVFVPLKAALMNLLSVAAAYGVLTVVFQWGWGSHLLGMDGPQPISAWVPMLMFCVLFGLSMDYEVFLLTAIREEWRKTPDAVGSVRDALASTAGVITIAAAIMLAVFLGFSSEDDVIVKMLGVGMAAAIFVDATLIRLVLVPSTMVLLGRWNWWPGEMSRASAAGGAGRRVASGRA